MKNIQLGVVRNYFTTIEEQVAEKLRIATKNENNIRLIQQALVTVLRRFFTDDKQNTQNNQQLKQNHFNKQRTVDQSNQISKMKRQMDLEFELTRKFVKQFTKNNAIAQDTSFLYSPRNVQPKPLNASIDLSSIYGKKAEENIGSQNMQVLNRLKKLQKFMYKKGTPGCLTSRTNTQQYTFSPSKDEIKQENKRLKIQLSNTKSQLYSLQNNDLQLGQQFKQKQKSIIDKQHQLSLIQSQLIAKQQQLTKKQAQLMVKSKLFRNI